MKKRTFLGITTLAFMSACTPPPAPPPVDTTAPTVVLTATPTLLTGGGQVTLSAVATDDTGVTSVTFYRGNVLLQTDTTAPYEAVDTLTAPLSDTAVPYRAVAADAAGNTSEKTVTVTSQPALPVALPKLTVKLSQGATGYNFADTAAPGRTVTLYTDSKTALTTGIVQKDYSVTLSPVSSDSLVSLARPFPGAVPPTCTNSLKVNDPALLSFNVNSISIDTTGLTISGISALTIFNPDGSSPSKSSAYGSTGPNYFMYADRTTTVTGSVTCSDEFGGNVYTFDLSVKKGWNFVQSSYTNGQPSTMIYKTIDASDVILAIGSS